MAENNSNLKFFLTVGALLLAGAAVFTAQNIFDDYKIRILNLAAVYVILGLGLNVINGFTGLFSLGHAGFMMIGAYTAALLSMPPAAKAMNFYMKPLIAPLTDVHLPIGLALPAAGLVAAFFGLLIAAPVLRLKGDYLAIASLGFAEIMRVLFTMAQSITNGALGLKGIPSINSMYFYWTTALVTLILVKQLVNSSYGRALKAIRDDEIAAEAMGINLFYHKVLSFSTGAFFAGIGGALLGFLVTTIDPNMFTFLQTFNILMIIVLGGLGSLTGTVISAIIVAVMMEVLRIVDAPINLGFISLPGVAGMRMVIFSLLLLLVILFYQHGIMGTREFNWNWIINKIKHNGDIGKKGGKSHGAVGNG